MPARSGSATGAPLAVAEPPARIGPGRTRAILAAGSVVGAVAVLLVLAVYALPILLTRHPTPTDAKDVLAAQNAARTALIGALVALFTAATLAVSWRSHRLTQTGQLTDRFAAAVEQLGSASTHVRVGGIYSLERLLHDSPADHRTVVEVLSTFIRDQAPPARRVDPSELNSVPMLSDGDLVRDIYARPTTDVDAAIRVLVRREPSSDEERIDFRRIHLVRLEASNARLSGVRLSQSDLSFANLTRSSLRAATLRETILFCAQLDDAVMEGAKLDWAVANGTSAKRASFRGASLRHSRMLGVDFRNAVFDDADLSDVDLTGAWLDGAVFRGASLRRAVLRGARCLGCDFSGADVSAADLTGVRIDEEVLTADQRQSVAASDWTTSKAKVAGTAAQPSSTP